ncbi:hypothetical protein [Flexithrix dorotheae]|uniref:hypothetical protein n=1 Tax=Flexithrix dorotheae TaxID=70993 RepID=UPI00036460EE|nr:hypothetical protein [Flexithrix dorotheae]
MPITKKRSLELNTINYFIAFDAKSGEILHIHETMEEQGNYQNDKNVLMNEEKLKTLTSHDFEKRSVAVIKLPPNFQLKPEKKYWVDPISCELNELSTPTELKFRDVLRLKGEF